MALSRVVDLNGAKVKIPVGVLRKIIQDYTSIYASVDIDAVIKVAEEYKKLMHGSVDNQLEPSLVMLTKIKNNHKTLQEMQKTLANKFIKARCCPDKLVTLKASLSEAIDLLDLNPIMIHLKLILANIEASRALIANSLKVSHTLFPPALPYRHNTKPNVWLFSFVMSVMLIMGMPLVLNERKPSFANVLAFVPGVMIMLMVRHCLDQANERKHFSADLKQLEALENTMQKIVVAYASDIIKEVKPDDFPHEQLKKRRFQVEPAGMRMYKTQEERQAIASVLSRSRKRNIRSPMY